MYWKSQHLLFSSAIAAGTVRTIGSGGNAVTFVDGISKPKPDVEFIENRGFATDETAWEDGGCGLIDYFFVDLKQSSKSILASKVVHQILNSVWQMFYGGV